MTARLPPDAPAPVDRQPSRAQLRAAWLARVRWGAVAGQALVVVGAQIYLAFGSRVLVLLAITACTAISNVVFTRRLHRGLPVSDQLAGAILVFDTGMLTALLAAAGGPSNPFSVLYLVQITIAAVMLGSRWTWALAGLSSVCYALLFALPQDPMSAMEHAGHGQWTFSLHLEGMWLALVMAAALTAYFVTRLSTSLERRESELAAAREASARQERLAAVTTLAAGAAHELATPMATIAVTAREVERELTAVEWPGVDSLRDDARLIRAELERCRGILQRMSPSADVEVEAITSIDFEALAEDVRAGLRESDVARVRVRVDAQGRVDGPRRALSASLLNLVRNALEASPPEGVVTFELSARGGWLHASVHDQGAGMSAAALSHAGEPFFTTKPPGQGMGLGLFLARALAERLGGRLVLDSAPARGTLARLELPLSNDMRSAT